MVAPDGGGPSRGRRRVAARRGSSAPTRATGSGQAPQVDPGWEALVEGSDIPKGGVARTASPAEPTVEPEVDARVVVVATTPGASAPRVVPALAPAPRVTKRRPPAATPPAATPPAPSGGPDPSSELGRVFSRLLVRMANVERRLDGFEERVHAVTEPDESAARTEDPGKAALEADREYDRQMLSWLADRVEALTAEIGEQRRQAEVGADAVGRAVNRTETVSVEVDGLRAQVDHLVASQEQPDPPEVCPDHQRLAPTVADMEREAAVAADRALAVEARVAQLETLPSMMDEVATRQFQRLAAELPSAPVDIEAVYKELDSVAEVLAARDAAVARGLEQVESLGAAVSGLRDDVVRLADALAASRAADEESRDRIRTLEHRLDVMDSPEHDVERLYTALDRARGGAPGPAGPDAVGSTGIRVADGGAGAQGPASTSAGGRSAEPSQHVIQTLVADLDRIRRSLEVLADEVPPPG